MRYDRGVTATLQALDVYLMYIQSDALLGRIRDALAAPLRYTAPQDDLSCLVEAQVLPESMKASKFYLYFHADREDEPKGRKAVVTAHLRYRRRPPGAIPGEMKALKSQGHTVEWVDKTFLEVGSPVLFVETMMELPSRERPGPSLQPPVSIGSSTLKRCGEEYRAESSEIGEVSSFRWQDGGPGRANVWLRYSHPADRVPSIWLDEEERCRKHLQQLV